MQEIKVTLCKGSQELERAVYTGPGLEGRLHPLLTRLAKQRTLHHNFVLPAALYGLLALRIVLGREQTDARSAAVPSLLTSLGFGVSIHLAICLDKALALGWAAAVD